MANRTHALGFGGERGPLQEANTQFQDVKAGRCTSFCMTSLLQRGSPQHKRDVAAPASTLLHVSRAIAPAGVAVSPHETGYLTPRRTPHRQIKKNANFQAICTISVEHIFIIIMGSCREVRSQEAEKRNQIFGGLTRIKRVAVRLLKQKKQIS